jgi:SAM-dependent methyltransferase
MTGYLHAADLAFDRVLGSRSAASSAAFFQPHLRAGMRLLDCGCGPGAITLGLAALVAPGEVVGVDLDQRLISEARAGLAEQRVGNARFEVADVSRLPFADAAFDAVFAHTLFLHLPEPAAAARELRRVLAPGGVVGIRDPDEGATLIGPIDSPVVGIYALLLRALGSAGGRPDGARAHRGLLVDAGFQRVEASAQAISFGTPTAIRQAAQVLEARLRSPGVVARIRGAGWLDDAGLDAASAAIRAWAERPDAFLAITMCAAIGWA